VNAGDRPELRTITAANVQMRSIEWLEKPLLQASAFTLVAGPKGVGKGTWLAKTAAKFTRGVYGAPQNVVFISSEDSASIDLVPRLRAAGADVECVHIVADHVTLPVDLDRLEALVTDIGNVGMLVIDPVGNHLGGVDTDKEGAIRHALAGLNKLADELNCVVLGVRHIGKARQNGALAAILGSVAWSDLPRQVLMFARDDEDEMVFHVGVIAGNRTGRGAIESFRIELEDVGLKEPVTLCRELGASAKDIDTLLSAAKPEKGEKRAGARDIILRELANGPQPLDYLKSVAGAEVGASGDTTWRAANELKKDGLVKAYNSGPGTPWLWRLTSAALTETPHESKTSSHAITAEVKDFVTETRPLPLDFGSNAHATKSEVAA
jgi:hypothetical protein